ncbi:hypothetical protein LF817_11205 [Halobacillus sp. A1]|uniref:hypothetical protein n=1 Tax=Halobacillus sp. A1 TaxID=2880262 RepID=UPI0020A6AC2E|nr:hypothetical protein [Halobacillus sp. A1]MCP3031912.1 hypothetical protein [Halobacillus sp. A1]
MTIEPIKELYFGKKKLKIHGRYSVRIDNTIVIEPSDAPEEQIDQYIGEQKKADKVSVKSYYGVPPRELPGPYVMKKSLGLLILGKE